jgi:ABC-2 type transport system permease protein
VVNLDAGGQYSEQLLNAINQTQGYKAQLYDPSEAEDALTHLRISRYLVIPADFTEKLSNAEKVSLILITHPNANPDTTQTLVDILSGVGDDLSLELQILDGIRRMGQMQAINPDVQAGFNAERIEQQARDQFEASRQTPLIAVVEREPASEAEAGPQFDLSSTFVPGMCVLFVFLSSSSVARSLFEERKSGTLRRLMSAPLTRTTLLAGKMIPIFLLMLVQVGVIFAAGGILFPIMGFGVLSIGEHPLAWALTSILIAVCSTCLGMLIAATARTEGQAGNLSNALLWVAGFLGGALFPVWLLKQIPVVNVVMRFVPHSWATSAYYDILTRGKGLADVWPNLLVLLGFSALFFVIGVRRFRFE